jgi:hypothetical protein
MRNNSDNPITGRMERMNKETTQFDLATGPSTMELSRETEKEMVL